MTYEIPKGIADDHFIVDSVRGIVTTKGTFDREKKDLYIVPIYVMESSSQLKTSSSSSKTSGLKPSVLLRSQFDLATIMVRIADVNDHAPEFRPGSCFPLAIPENSELSIIHRVVAVDLDDSDGPNGHITYSITGLYISIVNFYCFLLFFMFPMA